MFPVNNYNLMTNYKIELTAKKKLYIITHNL